MAGRGRPTKFDATTIERSAHLARLGATDAEICEHLNVATSTFCKWKLEYPEFAEALKEAKLGTDANVAGKLYERALGFEWEEEVPIKVKTVLYAENGKKVSEEEHIEVVKVKRLVPPDTTAAIFWLKNRRSDDWRDKTVHEHIRRNVTEASDEELATIALRGSDGAVASAEGSKGVH